MKIATHIFSFKAGFLHQSVLKDIQVGLVVIGALFWVQALHSNDAFSADLYGDFALIFPAEFWAVSMAGPAAMIWVGLQNPIHRGMVAIGSFLQTLQFLALAYSAIATNGELVIGLFCSVIFAPLHLRICAEAIINARME